jgi:choline dehydrogenase-like flavoprotein
MPLSGVNGVRVVDASSFPFLLPGHPQSVVYMLAERAADFLKLARNATITTTPRTTPTGDPGLPYSGPN